MKKWIKLLGSLSFALWLIGGLVAVLTLSTLLESAHGTPFVQRFFYQAGWFDVFLALFGLNILCSSLSRWPYKKHHTGFLIVHTGILMLLTGSFMSRYGGVDGQMALYEGESGNRILLPGYELVIHLPDHSIKIQDLGQAARLVRVPIADPEPDVKIVLKKALVNAAVSEITEEGGSDAPANAGITFTLKSSMAGANQHVALFQHHPSNPSSNVLAMGAATFELMDSAPVEEEEGAAALTKPRLRIVKKDTGETFTWDLDPLPTQDLPLGSTGFVIKNLRYLPDARVNDAQKLVNVSDEPLNPAVEFEAVDGAGHQEFHTRFELFPDFESLHGRNKNDLLHLAVDLETPGIKKALADKKSAGIQFFMKDGRWAYHSHSSKSPDTNGFLELGKEYPAGWMDFTFTVEQFFSHAQILKKINETSAGSEEQKADIAVEVAVEKSGHEVSAQWVLPGESLKLDTAQGPLIIALRQRSASVPFSLTLKDFRKVDYPGTSEALSYESDVALEDKAEGLKIEKTIRMNKPLDHKGYRIFQSSFSQDPEAGETSVFTVAKNPGIWLIYGGSIVMCLGILIVFYIKPLSSFSVRGNAHASKKR
jgi:hypothetical protein